MEKNKINPSNIDIDDVEIHIKIKEEGKFLAQVTIRYKDLKIKGFRVSHSKYKNEETNEGLLWVQPPCIFAGRWYPIVIIDDKDNWKKLQDKIIQEYQKKSDEYFRNKLKAPKVEESTLEDIQF